MAAESVVAIAVGKVVEQAVQRLAASMSGDGRLRVDKDLARVALLDHLQMVETWCKEISFRDMLRPKDFDTSFVELALQLGLGLSDGDVRAPNQSISQLYCGNRNTIILGHPGAGKTTTLQRLGQLALRDRESGKPIVPILIRLRDLRPPALFVPHLLAILGIIVSDVRGVLATPEGGDWLRRVLSEYLDYIGALLLVDGLDEVSDELRTLVESEIEDLLLHSTESRVVVTCRKAEYRRHFHNCEVVSVRPLTWEQIAEFAGKWLGDRASRFLGDLSRSPFAKAAVLPLTLAHLCAIYERRGEIPRKPSEIYEKIVRLSLEEWDEQRGIRRESHYANFATQRKERFVKAVSYELTAAGRVGSFSDADLRDGYLKVCDEFELPSDEAAQVAREIESHTGLIVEIGEGDYEFAHAVIQEYLTAAYLGGTLWGVSVGVPNMPNELAIAVALSSRPDEYLESILTRSVADSASPFFLYRFATRLYIERPDFRPGARLAWTLLALHAALVRGSFEAADAYRASRVLAQFAVDKRVQSSFRALSGEADISTVGATIKIRPKNVRRLASAVEKVMQALGIQEFVLDSNGFDRSLLD